MKRNVIILTSGLTGSSVLTGLICRAGYWAGESTQKKEDYDTYENRELIQLNLSFFELVGYTGNYTMEFSEKTIQRINSLAGKIDDREYKLFLRRCNEHRPWIWKDPRLWLTIRFWKNLLDLEDCKFIFLTRGLMQSWVSATLRRQIWTYRDYVAYEERIKSSLLSFFADNSLPYLHVRYEELIMHPAETIHELNGFLATRLTIEDLKVVYHKPLFENPRTSIPNYAKATLIYLKNHRRRVDALRATD
jgi:hypothetical protein